MIRRLATRQFVLGDESQDDETDKPRATGDAQADQITVAGTATQFNSKVHWLDDYGLIMRLLQ